MNGLARTTTQYSIEILHVYHSYGKKQRQYTYAGMLIAVGRETKDNSIMCMYMQLEWIPLGLGLAIEDEPSELLHVRTLVLTFHVHWHVDHTL